MKKMKLISPSKIISNKLERSLNINISTLSLQSNEINFKQVFTEKQQN